MLTNSCNENKDLYLELVLHPGEPIFVYLNMYSSKNEEKLWKQWKCISNFVYLRNTVITHKMNNITKQDLDCQNKVYPHILYLSRFYNIKTLGAFGIEFLLYYSWMIKPDHGTKNLFIDTPGKTKPDVGCSSESKPLPWIKHESNRL